MIAYSCRAPHVKIRPDELGSDLRDDGVARTLEDADSMARQWLKLGAALLADRLEAAQGSV